jgi:AraC-like DNA-binding protein
MNMKRNGMTGNGRSADGTEGEGGVAAGAAAVRDRAVWRRVAGPDGPLDLLTARFARRHYAPHAHEEFALGVCESGQEVIRFRRGLVYAGRDSVVVIEPGEVHTGGPAAPGGFAYRALYPRTALLREVDAHARFPEPVVRDPSLARALRGAHRSLCAGRDPLEAESLLLGAFGMLVERHALRGPGAGRARTEGAGGEPVVRAVMARLADEMTAPPPLAEVAAGLGLSRYQVLRTFRAAVGIPPYAWLAQYRVARARRMLADGLRPAEVAPLVGFADQAHLTRWFGRVVGVTPGAYRSSVRNGVQDGGGHGR